MSSESVAWAVALSLVALGLWGNGSSLWGTTGEAPRRECAEPRRLETSGAWTEVLCGGGGTGRPPAAAHASLDGAAGLLFGIPIDLNRAAAKDLVALPGIGPARAEAIVLARGEAPFCEVAALQRVYGIGPRSVAGLAGWARAECPGAVEKREELAQ